MLVLSSKIQVFPLQRLDQIKERDPRLPHVVLLVDQFPKALGGGERVLLKLASQLPRYGFSVSIVTFSVDPDSALHTMALDCPVYILPLRRAFGYESLKEAAALASFLEEQEVRIVQTFFESSDLWGGLVTHFLSDAKLIWSRRDMGFLRARKHRLAYRLLSSLPDRVLAVSEQVRKHILQADEVDASKVLTVYNGLDVFPSDPYQSRMRREDVPLHIATVGNIRRIKGHDLFIHAAAAVIQQYPNVRFTIAGEVLEPNYFTELQNSIRSLGLAKHFFFAGSVANTREFLQDVDIFVLPSRSEGFSNAIIEAMASGLPVIATEVGGNAEAIDHDTTGLIIPANDVPSLTNAVLKLCLDRPFSERLATAAREKVVRCFSLSSMMEQTAAIYRTLLYGG